MSTQAKLGDEITHDGVKCLVQRIVHSFTLFEDPKEGCYLLEEHYAQLMGEGGQIKFLFFGNPIKTPFVKVSQIKGVDTRVWKRF